VWTRDSWREFFAGALDMLGGDAAGLVDGGAGQGVNMTTSIIVSTLNQAHYG